MINHGDATAIDGHVTIAIRPIRSSHVKDLFFNYHKLQLNYYRLHADYNIYGHTVKQLLIILIRDLCLRCP